MTIHRRRSALAAALALFVIAPVLATATTVVPAAADPITDVKINEVESSGGTPGDWIELINNGVTSADVSGWVVKDNDDGHSYTLPEGSTISAGEYLVVDTDLAAHPGNFGLGGADSARLFAPGVVEPVDSYTWASAAAITYGRCPNGTGSFVNTAASTRGAANSCPSTVPDVKINEVESNGGTPGDWVELINNGATPADVSGWVVKDSDDTHLYTIPESTTIAVGGYLVVDTDLEAHPGSFGLGSADTARLFTAGAATLVDSYAWTSHAGVTYGRCPNGTGAFANTAGATYGATNSCAGDPLPWPGGSAVAVADGFNVLGGNMSGLEIEASGTSAPGVLWAVKNGPGTLFRLLWDGTKWVPDAADGWGAGKVLKFPGGTGDVDAEGVTLVDGDPANGVYVSSERDNLNNGVSRPGIQRFDVSAPGAPLVATTEWNLTTDLPGLGANLGLEAIQHLPDELLVAKGFFDEAANAVYDPATYPTHGSGLFFVGAEGTGLIYGYALEAGGSFTRVATIDAGFTNGVMELEYEPETTHLWAVCDDGCGGRHVTLDIAQSGDDDGRFTVTNVYGRPTGMANLNNEGFAIAPQAECVDGLKPVVWSDDANIDSHALRSGTISCTPLPRRPLGDFTGDGKTDLAVFRPSTGVWSVQGQDDVAWGRSGDVPVPGDYDGDGDTDVAVFRPSNGRWYVFGSEAVAWGRSGDVPVPGDYDGDGDADVAVFRPSNGRWYVSGSEAVAWGRSGDVPVPGDYDGDGDADVAVFRPSNGGWYVLGADAVAWGAAGDVPVPGDYEGDGDADVAVFRPASGRWYVLGVPPVVWGASEDVPVPGQYDDDPELDLTVLRRSLSRWSVEGSAPVVFGQSGDIPVIVPPALRPAL